MASWRRSIIRVCCTSASERVLSNNCNLHQKMNVLVLAVFLGQLNWENEEMQQHIRSRRASQTSLTRARITRLFTTSPGLLNAAPLSGGDVLPVENSICCFRASAGSLAGVPALQLCWEKIWGNANDCSSQCESLNSMSSLCREQNTHSSSQTYHQPCSPNKLLSLFH